MEEQVYRKSHSASVIDKYKSTYTSTGDVYAIDSDVDVLRIEPENEKENTDFLDHVDSDLIEPPDSAGCLVPNDGVMDDETLMVGLCNLKLAADGESLAYIQLSLPGYHLTDISIMADHIHLQKIELPWNDLTDLSALNNMIHLLVLDISHNKLTALLDFSPPRNLKIVDFSFNLITEIDNLSHHTCLEKLYLSNNMISEMKGLSYCSQLTTLDLGHNNLREISGLGTLPIKHLTLNGNKLMRIDGLAGLEYLEVINLSGNKIRSLRGLEGHAYLQRIDLEDNEVIDIAELFYIRESTLLRDLNLLRNPIQEFPDYWYAVVYHLPQLAILDLSKIDPKDKIAGENMYSPSKEVVASCDHIMNTVFRFFQPTCIWESTLSNIDTPYPMLVLVGPCDSGKKQLSMKLAHEFPEYFGYGISHTTRRPLPDETDGKDYHFVNRDQFEYDVKTGKFIQTCEHQKFLYGLQMNSVEKIAKKGLATITHMELEGMLGLKKTYLEPRYILILPLDKEYHEKRMRSAKKRSEASIVYQLRRTEMYAAYNRDHPGFFDIVINSDSVRNAYDKLRHLIMDYLGLSHDVRSSNDPSSLVQSRQSSAKSRQSKPQSPRSESAKSEIGIVAEESIKRREDEAMKAVSGEKEPLFESLITESQPTTPTAHLLVKDTAETAVDRPVSVPMTSGSATSDINAGDPRQFASFHTSSHSEDLIFEPAGMVVDRPGSSKHKVLPPICASENA